MESFQNLTRVVEHYSGYFGAHSTLIEYQIKQDGITNADPDDVKAAQEKSSETNMAMAFL